MLQAGMQAPLFQLPDQSGQKLNLADLIGEKTIVLYFYPKDDTPGCTIEAQQFTQLADEFAAANTVVIGVSQDSCNSHQEFINKYDLKVILISDEDGELCRQYGVWQEKEKNGQRKMGIVRSTFIINPQGKLAKAEYGVTPDGHAADILKQVQ